jgi:cysteine desulfurase/selenocysteine lyase
MLARYDDALQKRPDVVVLTHCSNVSGVYYPVADMAARAKAAGAVVVVDAAQSAPHVKLSTGALNADFIAVAGHKMLGPTGTGLLIGTAEQLERLSPTFAGGGSVDWVDSSTSRWRALPHRLEAGTPHIAGVIGLAAAVDYLERIGMSEVARHDSDVAAALRREASKRERLRVIEPSGDVRRAALVSMVVLGASSVSDIARSLSDSFGIMARTGYLCAQPYVSQAAKSEVLRLSAYVYNSEEDVLRAFSALDELIAAFAH